ncbi:MAG: hypothetical protein JSU61_14050, partial [Fidelibacterota bacterium]
MEVPSCPGYSLGIPRVILGEPVELPVHHNPGKEPVQNTVIILPPAVENYNPQGALSVPQTAIGTRLNLL